MPAPRLRPADREVRAMLYARVSMVGAREEIISPEVQVNAATHLTAERGWTLADDPIVELDATGRNFAREGIRAAIEGVEAGRWDVVVVYRYDRFGRNVRDSLVNIARVEAAGGEVVSATEPFDATTAIGKYGRTNILAVAELQSDLIGENWKAAHASRLARGLPHSGGYRLGYTQPDKHRYVPDPEWAPIVIDAYRRYIGGDGAPTIARWLTALNAPSRYKNHFRWSPAGVRSFLASGFAAGLLHHEDGTYQPGAHEAILPPGLWEDYLRTKESRATTPIRLRKAATVVSGLVYCGHCDHRMRANGHAVHGAGYSFTCVNLHCPRRVSRLTRFIEADVLAWLADYDTEVTTRAQARAGATEHRAVARSERRSLSRAIARIDAALVRLTKDKATGDLPDSIYRTARDELIAERDAATAELARLGGEAAITAPKRPVVRGLIKDWPRLRTQPHLARDILAPMLWVRITRDDDGAPRTEVIPRWEQAPPEV